MTLNNFSSNPRKIEYNAEKNYNEYERSFSTLKVLGENEKMLSNLEHMKQKLRKLLEEGTIKNDDFNYTHLKSIYENAVQIQVKTNKSLDDISNFYIAYNNFNDVFNNVSGDIK